MVRSPPPLSSRGMSRSAPYAGDVKSIRVALLAALVLALLAMGVPSAWGHAAYKSSDPADGAEVSAPPSDVTAEFTEPLAEGSYLQVTDPCGRRVDGGDVRIVGYDMSVSMSGAAAGRYVVAYRAFSRLDPHVTQGEFSFSASDGETCPGEQEASTTAPRERSGSNEPETETVGVVAAAGAGPESSSGESTGSAAARRRSARVRARSGKPFKLAPQRAVVPNVQAAAAEDDEEEPSVWDGIPIESFVTGLLLAAIIGAAGGKIYAGIMGPRA